MTDAGTPDAGDVVAVVSFLAHGDLVVHQAYATDGQITAYHDGTASVLFASALAPVPASQGTSANDTGSSWQTANCDYTMSTTGGGQLLSVTLSSCTGAPGWVLPETLTKLSDQTLEVTAAAVFNNTTGAVDATAATADGEASMAFNAASNAQLVGDYQEIVDLAYTSTSGAFEAAGISEFNGQSDQSCSPLGPGTDCGTVYTNVTLIGSTDDAELQSNSSPYKLDGVGEGTGGPGHLVSDNGYAVYTVFVADDAMGQVVWILGHRAGAPDIQNYGFIVYGTNSTDYEYATVGILSLAADNTASIEYSATVAPTSGSTGGSSASNTGPTWQTLSGCGWQADGAGDITLTCTNTTSWVLPTQLSLVADGTYAVAAAADMTAAADTANGEATPQGTGPFSTSTIWNTFYNVNGQNLYSPIDGAYPIAGQIQSNGPTTSLCPDGVTYGCVAELGYIGPPNQEPVLEGISELVVNADGTVTFFGPYTPGPAWLLLHFVLSQDGAVMYGIGVNPPDMSGLETTDGVAYSIGRAAASPPDVGTLAFYVAEGAGGMSDTPYVTLGTMTLSDTPYLGGGTATLTYSASMAPCSASSGCGTASNTADSWQTATCSWSQNDDDEILITGCNNDMAVVPWAMPATLTPSDDTVGSTNNGSQWIVTQVSVDGGTPQDVSYGTGQALLQNPIPGGNQYFAGRYAITLNRLYDSTSGSGVMSGYGVVDGQSNELCPDGSYTCGQMVSTTLPPSPSPYYEVNSAGLESGDFGMHFVLLQNGTQAFAMGVNSSLLPSTDYDVDYAVITYDP